jgi:RNA polymerase-binding transcription factor DksA
MAKSAPRETLDPAQVRLLQQKLDQREAELQAEVREADAEGRETPEVPGPHEPGDAADSGDQRFQTGMAHVDKQRDQEELMAIETARTRMADGTSGVCVDCGGAIPFERLQAQPTALRCIACQSAYEKTHPPAPRLAM